MVPDWLYEPSKGTCALFYTDFTGLGKAYYINTLQVD